MAAINDQEDTDLSNSNKNCEVVPEKDREDTDLSDSNDNKNPETAQSSHGPVVDHVTVDMAKKCTWKRKRVGEKGRVPITLFFTQATYKWSLGASWTP